MHSMTPVLQLDEDDRATLESWSRSTATRAELVTRARIVLAAGDGLGTSETARRLGVSRPTVIRWRERYVGFGLAGLDDAPRSGRPKRVDEAAKLDLPPVKLG